MKLFVILELNRPSPYLTFIKQKVVANTILKMYPSTQDHAQTFWGACAETEKGHPPIYLFFVTS